MSTGYIAVCEPTNNTLGVMGLLVSDLQEGETKISSELSEKIVAGKTDYSYQSVAEEINLTFGRIPGDKGQDQFKKAIKERKQIKVWLIEKKKREDGYHAAFGYTVVEEYGNSFDDEEDTIEVTVKVKFNTADGVFEELPPSWLDASVAGTTVEFEKPGEYTGDLEERKSTSKSFTVSNVDESDSDL
ncbi:phage tail protein [Staphylococcus chromogenes]|uniref:phage tail protein n=1 Tax=Staphylococcus chromogenes TaxID=46126 RepID=UPI000D1B99A6|nr:phage tail protein [Staphylococcus chromogenes]PTF49653.1 phage tail protein [Staphylococcus chromogenes]PTF57695.1 phage tail protein [Staphylococcus chromogenes]PTF65064.1 phage tail protein [Staphylococcus chromogenes]PTF76538.1 phage tail protein [Staphylococcus chromogenes]PTF93527.1 phage tail protein [Staphylococcus chromogenes]